MRLSGDCIGRILARSESKDGFGRWIVLLDCDCMASGVQPAIGGLALNIMEWILWYICITVDLSTSILKYALCPGLIYKQWL